MSPDPSEHNRHGSNGWRTCCEAHVESAGCNWVECFRVWVGTMRSLTVQRMTWYSRHTAARAFAPRRGLGRQRHVQTRLHHISQCRRSTLHRIQPTFSQRQPAENRKMIGLRHVEAHRSQKELRLESLATDPVSKMKPIQLCAICGKPADIPWVTMFRTSTGEFIRLWYCRGCWIDWNAQDNDANVNTVLEWSEVELTIQTSRAMNINSYTVEVYQMGRVA